MIEQEIFHGNMLCIFSRSFRRRRSSVCRANFSPSEKKTKYGKEQAMIINVTCLGSFLAESHEKSKKKEKLSRKWNPQGSSARFLWLFNFSVNILFTSFFRGGEQKGGRRPEITRFFKQISGSLAVVTSNSAKYSLWVLWWVWWWSGKKSWRMPADE